MKLFFDTLILFYNEIGIMRNKNSNRTKNNDSSKISDENSKKKFLDEYFKKLQIDHNLEIDSIIEKNKKLLAILAHDIRGPMGLVVGHLRLLKSRSNNLNANETKEGIENALRSAEKSFLLLENLLSWATAENNTKKFQQEYIDLELLIQDELENINSFALKRQITIYLNDFPKTEIFVDANMIKTVFRNILHNAIKNTFIKGEIIISIIKQTEYVEISIKDNGIGIKEEIQKSLFTAKNIDLNSNAIKEPGNGFGLVFCKEIIDLHKGVIGVTSQLGLGSEFKFTLPLGPI
jgi:signal transduction histidine kinase